MPAKQITHKEGGLTAVFREKLGADVLDASTVHHILAQHIAKQLRITDAAKLPSRFWGRFIFVSDVMQQTVSLAGDDRFDIPTIDASPEDIVDFYDFVMQLPEKTIEFFRTGLRKFENVPLVTGGSDDSDSKDESAEETETTVTETTAHIPA
jgi:hypothetical protein